MVPSFPAYEVFISHAREDKASIAIPLRRKLLEEHKIKAFVDETDIQRGKNAKEAIFFAMENAHIAIIILSPEYVAKEWPMKELLFLLQRHQEAVDKGMEPVPVVVPFFYRLSVAELYHEPRHRSTDEATKRLYDETRFFKRMARGEPEANVGTIRGALAKLHETMGIKNYVDASNDESSYNMTRKREVLLGELVQVIAPQCLRHSDRFLQPCEEKGAEGQIRSATSPSAYYPSGPKMNSGIPFPAPRRPKASHIAQSNALSSGRIFAAQHRNALHIALHRCKCMSVLLLLLLLLFVGRTYSAGQVTFLHRLLQSPERKDDDVGNPALIFGDRPKESFGACKNKESVDTDDTPEQKDDYVGSSTFSVLDRTQYSLGIGKNWKSAYIDSMIWALHAPKEMVIRMLWAIAVFGTACLVGLGLFIMGETGSFLCHPKLWKTDTNAIRIIRSVKAVCCCVGGVCVLRDLDPPKQIGYILELAYVMGVYNGVCHAWSEKSRRRDIVPMMTASILGYILLIYVSHCSTLSFVCVFLFFSGWYL